MPDIFRYGTMKISLFMFNAWYLTALPYHSSQCLTAYQMSGLKLYR